MCIMCLLCSGNYKYDDFLWFGTIPQKGHQYDSHFKDMKTYALSVMQLVSGWDA